MDFFSNPLFAFFLLLGLLVFVHEAGHFIVGRLSGIAVEIFSIGFGPPIVRYVHNDTDYRISWIPLGGYVKFYGMSPAESVPSGVHGIPFRDAPLVGRSLTLFAGPFANLLLAFVVYTVLGMSGIPHARPLVEEITVGSEAERAGLEFQDEILAIDEQPIKTWREMRQVIASSPGKTLRLKIKRRGEVLHVDVTPDVAKQKNISDEEIDVGRLGIALGALPPVVAVRDPNSLAARSGLVTGHLIEEIEINGQWQKVKYWQAFLQELRAAIVGGQGELPIKVSLSPEIAGAGEGAASTVSLPLGGAEARSGLPITKLTKLRDVASIFGLFDAQLTVGKVPEEFKNVLKPGDQILRWEGEDLVDLFHYSRLQSTNKIPRVDLLVMRGFERRKLDLAAVEMEYQKPSGKDVVYQILFTPLGGRIHTEPWIEQYDNIFSGAWYGLKETAVQTTFLAGTVVSLISGNVPMKALGGPMLIAKVASDSAKAGWKAFINTMALISVNLGVLNLVPIPLLDGGQLVICAIEAIRRRKLSELAVENYQKVGFAMIMALVVLATYNDLSRFWTSMLESVAGYFQ